MVRLLLTTSVVDAAAALHCKDGLEGKSNGCKRDGGIGYESEL